MFEYSATVIRPVDGDTVILDVDLGFRIHSEMTIRFFGCNAPEISTPAGVAARDYLLTLIPVGTVLTLHSHKDQADKYGGRWLGDLFLLDGTDITVAMIAAKHAKTWNGKGVKPV